MALIECPECGKEVSDKARECLSCGYPISGVCPECGTRNLKTIPGVTAYGNILCVNCGFERQKERFRLDKNKAGGTKAPLLELENNLRETYKSFLKPEKRKDRSK